MVALIFGFILLVIILRNLRFIVCATIALFLAGAIMGPVAHAKAPTQHHIATATIGGMIVMLVSDVPECHGLTQAFVIAAGGPIIDKTCNITLDKANDEITFRFPSYGQGRPLPLTYSSFEEQY